VRIEFAKNTLIIGDDGAGIPEEKRGSVIERGVRLDDDVPGSGLGLSIARDIGELYGMTITLGRSDLGGLEVSIKIPEPTF
jgi:signal transduction histidine kinase